MTQKDIIPLCYGDLSKGKLGDILGDHQALDVKDRNDLRVLYDTIARKLRCNVPTVSSSLVAAIADFHAHYHPEQEADRYALANTEKVTIDYEKMRDGTLKALSPITGTLVWTIPARNRRPLSNILSRDPVLLDKSGARENECFFCEGRYHETTPEIARIELANGVFVYRQLGPDNVFDDSGSTANFRRVANLYPILSYKYWYTNYRYSGSGAMRTRKTSYLSSDVGRTHVDSLLEKLASATSLSESDKMTMEDALFFGAHDLIIAKRHFREDAATKEDKCGPGDLSETEHLQYFKLTISAMDDIYKNNQHVRYVTVFQNWLAPAGATVDHLHKQLAGIDDYGLPIRRYLGAVQKDRNVFDKLRDVKAIGDLIIAENEHAVAFIDEGRRYPTVAIFSKSSLRRPQECSDDDIAGMSSLVHACHSTLGSKRPTNEEWYYAPPSAEGFIPWHVLILLRDNVQAGFEHATRICINPYPAQELKDRLAEGIFARKKDGRFSDIHVYLR